MSFFYRLFFRGNFKLPYMNKPNKNSNALIATAFGSEIWTDASAPPKSPNEGGTADAEFTAESQSSTDPRLVTQGGKV